jgi:hypothetical protein
MKLKKNKPKRTWKPEIIGAIIKLKAAHKQNNILHHVLHNPLQHKFYFSASSEISCHLE